MDTHKAALRPAKTFSNRFSKATLSPVHRCNWIYFLSMPSLCYKYQSKRVSKKFNTQWWRITVLSTFSTGWLSFKFSVNEALIDNFSRDFLGEPLAETLEGNSSVDFFTLRWVNKRWYHRLAHCSAERVVFAFFFGTHLDSVLWYSTKHGV